MKQEFKYKCLHIPTQKSISRKVKCVNRLEFLELLNDWNRLGFGLWQYSEDNGWYYERK